MFRYTFRIDSPFGQDWGYDLVDFVASDEDEAKDMLLAWMPGVDSIDVSCIGSVDLEPQTCLAW